MSRKRKRRGSPRQSRSLLARLRHNDVQAKPLPKYWWLGAAALVLVIWAFSLRRFEPITPPEDADLVVYANAKCKCHRPWIRQLSAAGVAVGAVQSRNIMTTQADLGVPREFAACHTAVADGYWIEGHVPAASIKRLLTERPEKVGGLAYLRTEERTDGRFQWEVVTYDREGRPMSSETPLLSGESEVRVPHDQ